MIGSLGLGNIDYSSIQNIYGNLGNVSSLAGNLGSSGFGSMGADMLTSLTSGASSLVESLSGSISGGSEGDIKNGVLSAAGKYFQSMGLSSEKVSGLLSYYGNYYDQMNAMMNALGESMNSDGSMDFEKMMKSYLKSNFPGMSDSDINSVVKNYSSQFGNLAKMGDMSSLMSMVSGMGGGAGAGEIGGISSAGNNRHYAKKAGVDGLLADAGSMVGLNEHSNAAAINKVTKESGINCATTPWCAAFAMNMLKDHGVLDVSGCSNINYCPTITSWAKKEGIWANRSYTPQAGDAILFDWNGNGTAQHIGIVEKVANGKVYTIEGNSSDSVKRNSYSLSSGKILGYINCGAQK